MQKAMSPHHQKYLEVRGNSPHWKDKFRKKCMERVRHSRSKLLDKFRKIEVSNEAAPNFKDEALTVMETVWNGEQEFTHFRLNQEEEILLLEEIEKEIRQLNEKQVEDVVKFEEADLSYLIHQTLHKQIFCPICQKGILQESASEGVVGCHCGLLLRGTTLTQVESALSQTVSLHEKSCPSALCFSVSHLPSTDTRVANVLMSCAHCDWMTFLL